MRNKEKDAFSIIGLAFILVITLIAIYYATT